MMDEVEHVIHKSDYVTGMAAITAPTWLHHFQDYGAAYISVGGAILITIRIGLAIREWLRKPPGD